ncbi:hypothetical protein AA23498_1030 [Acetobacter nitrogenifigens DSM 23921 = NBRC 105050]|uniref:Lipoprotein n=1 Tax=Acetobacter nitrogenifigens DSM 23921 = NBRC 105050 TaxID=1120919 RepID=A0A511XAQ4_9PROT|nr:hypothetical protein [Acetobacter nitrogenifigens]GBQ90956.1 hypothetical protein AA23498_1030 [Acetobacter nitrogenifigens DSM 23921 = NBRC 105050]GEN60043.1 hypothetical protein ANI02nite_19270 [Acetobacter nitrogenifigens DSM 23921 = NBRC 105050]
MTVRHIASLAAAVSVISLTGCLDVPHPFRNPGGVASELAHNPPPSRLDVPTPTDVQMKPELAAIWAKDIAAILLQQSVPAIAQPTRPGDWWLKLRTERRGGQIVPLYSIMTPAGAVRATQEGTGVPVDAWSAVDSGAVAQIAHEGADQVVSALSGIQADQMDQDPHSLKHRRARVWFKGVTGAPGDGDVSLARAFAASFRGSEQTIQTSPQDADFTVATTVKLTAGPPGSRNNPQQGIEIAWRVTDSHDKEVGIATQLHDIQAHSLDGMWGDVAVAAAQQAAEAVGEMITRYTGRDVAPIKPPGQAGAPGTAAAGQTKAPPPGG